MKTFVDYLKENGKWTTWGIQYNPYLGEWEKYNISVTFTETEYVIGFNNELVCFPIEMDAEYLLQEFLYCRFQMEIRFCEECGIPYCHGYTAGSGDWYCCKDCFEAAMDNDYGVDKWRPSEQEGRFGGWYEYLSSDGEWDDTGIYYTEWN